VAHDEAPQGSTDRNRTIIIVATIAAVAAIAITAIVTLGGKSSTIGTTSTTRPKSGVTSTTVAPPTTTVVVTTLPPTATGSATTTPAQVITDSADQVIWQSGESIPQTGAGYEGYYCCLGPFPDGVDRSGSAGCSGSDATGTHLGGYYVNGKLC
jgi:hypothetical protein